MYTSVSEEEDATLSNLITTYHELNPNMVDELTESPSALEFMRYVAVNRPFVVRRAASEYAAVQKWNAHYLKEVLGDHLVKVAVTPSGNADAVIYDHHTGEPTFVEPYEIDEPFSEFLDSIQRDTALWQDDPSARRNVKYAQTQNSNLTSEYLTISADMPPKIDFASLALSAEPDAVNFWLGNARSTTSLHKDNYENIYVQVRGSKIFTLLSPCEMPCVNERGMRRGRYAPKSGQDSPSIAEDLELHVILDDDDDDTGASVPVPVWDPTKSAADEETDIPITSTPYSHLARPLQVRLDEGDMMYLPALWYHRVAQGNGAEGFSCSVNYWYDMDFQGGFWAMNQGFVRDVYASAVARKSEEAAAAVAGATRLGDC